jgi:Fic-DOC domain mobile mystery protein B
VPGEGHGSFFEPQDDAQTPLAPEEKRGLKQAWITYRHELNAAEQENIADAVLWAVRVYRRRDLLDERFLLELHRRMFRNVWDWAGSYRQTERNIGIASGLITEAVRNLLADARAWVAYNAYEPDELAVRFHHGLVAIHPFPNGNGRHARLMADLLIMKLGRARFSWGGGATNLEKRGEMRSRYVAALRKADGHDITDLLAFARS